MGVTIKEIKTKIKSISGKPYMKNLGRVQNKTISYTILLLMILVYAFTFSRLSIIQHEIFGTSGFDLGIQDQGIWLLSQGKTAFVTVRGLHLFGDHVTLIHLLLAPVYWIWNDVRAILVFQSVVLSMGAVPIYLLARDKLGGDYTPLVFPFCYLMYPALHYLNLWQFHPDALAVTFLLFAFYFVTKRRYYLYGLFTFLTLVCKEEISLTVFALGLYVAIKEKRGVGIITSLAAVIWLLLAIKVILPYFNGFGYFRHLYGYSVFGKFGHAPLEIVKNILINPSLITSQLFTEINGNYIFNLLAPVGFLSLFSFSTLAIALPSILSNILSGYYYTHLIKYHYTVAIIPFVFISVIYGVEKLRGRGLLRGVLILLIVSTLLANWYIAPGSASLRNFSQTFERVTNFNRIPTEREKAIMEGMKLIPANASISTTPFFVPQFTHREKIYVFPNPFRQSYWGINGENPPPKDVEYIFIDGNSLSEGMKDTLASIYEDGLYSEIFKKNNIILLKRKN